jgi:hypothetical protein
MVKRKSFYEFIDKKSREGRRHLHIIRDVLTKHGMKVSDFSEANDNDEPYIFLHNPEKESSFHGVRIYQIGEAIAFRIQREEKTQPYGTAYPLKIPDMFADLVEDMKEEEAGKKVMEYMCKELQKFFVLSSRAENDLPGYGLGLVGDPMDQFIVRSGGIDIARQVGNSI